MGKQLGFYGNVSKIFTEEELQKILADEEKFYQNYAKKEWLKNYHDFKKLANATQLPSITSVLSDMPTSGSNNRSKTEEYALKSVEAQERIDFLHDCLEKLPEDLREIIRKRFLMRNSAGRPYNNNYIADTIGISPAQFYRDQNKALYELGICLYQYEIMQHEQTE